MWLHWSIRASAVAAFLGDRIVAARDAHFVTRITDGMDILTNLSLFSGAGGLDLGARLIGGFRTVAYCEYDQRAQATLISGMSEGTFDIAPIWDDVSTFDGKEWRGKVDIISGGFPCQDISTAGKNRGIKDGTRSGLWLHFRRIISEVVPRFVLVENVAGLIVGGGLGIVLGTLDELGYDAVWNSVSAADVGAPHERERVWIVANAKCFGGISRRQAIPPGKRDMGVLQLPHSKGYWNGIRTEGSDKETIWKVYPEPKIYRMADGMEDWPYRIKQCGNGVVPQQSIQAWQKIKDMSR